MEAMHFWLSQQKIKPFLSCLDAKPPIDKNLDMSEDLWSEILHWMHQRGDTIGATRVLACCRWERLHTTQFEKPLVCVIGCGGDVYNGANADVIVNTSTLSNVRIRDVERVRAYGENPLFSYCKIVQFKTIGSIKHIKNLFSWCSFTSGEDLRLDMKNVESIKSMFCDSHYYGPVYWDMRNLKSIENIFKTRFICAPCRDIKWYSKYIDFSKMFKTEKFELYIISCFYNEY